MHHSVKLMVLQDPVESSRSSDVWDDSELELVGLESVAEVSGFGLRSDGSNNVIAPLKQDSDESDSNKAIGTCNEYGRHRE